MKFRLKHVFYLTTLIAMDLGLCAWWFSLQIPAHAGLIPLFLAAVVAGYFGWTHQPILLASLFAATTAACSASSIALRVFLSATDASFVSTINTRYHTDLTRNVVAIVGISVLCGIAGAAFAAIVGFLETSLRSRNFAKLSWFAVVGTALALISLWVPTLYPVNGANKERVQIGMSVPQVEAILGPPNPLPDLARKGEAYWDAYTHLGRRYVAIHVTFDSEQLVESVEGRGFWTTQPWLYW